MIIGLCYDLKNFFIIFKALIHGTLIKPDKSFFLEFN